jgi:copper chaperone NosL
VTVFLYLIACSLTPEPQLSLEPEPIGTSECAVCGMVVREQPAPRGQLIYGDGDHAFTCSLHGLHLLVRAPDPQGKPVAIYVEALEPSFDWTQSSTAPLPWVSANEAYFVAGAKRELVMGPPLLSYAEVEAAQGSANQLGVRPLRWKDLVKIESLGLLSETNRE